MVTSADPRPSGSVRTIHYPMEQQSLHDLTRWLSDALHVGSDEQSAEAVIMHLGGDARPPADDDQVDVWSRWEKVLRRLERWPAPTVAVVDGEVSGFAFHLVLTADLVFATPHSLLRCDDLGRGRLPGLALHRLAKYTGLGLAKQIVLRGRSLPAADALRVGLVSEVCADPTSVAVNTLRKSGSEVSWHLARRLLLESYASSHEDAMGAVLAAQERVLRLDAAD
jgi:isomerase DpgB